MCPAPWPPLVSESSPEPELQLDELPWPAVWVVFRVQSQWFYHFHVQSLFRAVVVLFPC